MQQPEVFYKKSVLQNFGKLTGKHFYWSLLFNKVVSLTPGILSKREALTKVFSFQFWKIFKKAFYRALRVPPSVVTLVYYVIVHVLQLHMWSSFSQQQLLFQDIYFLTIPLSRTESKWMWKEKYFFKADADALNVTICERVNETGIELQCQIYM